MSFFSKENLKNLGLTDEQVETIFIERGKEIKQIREQEEKNNIYKTQLEELNKELNKELKVLKDNPNSDDFKNKINELNTKHQEEIKKLETEKLQQLKILNIKMHLENVHDKDIVTNLIDIDKIQIDENGNVISGLKEQIQDIQTNKPFLFKIEEKITGIKPAEGIKQENIPPHLNYSNRLDEARKTGNIEESIRIINEANENGVNLR